MNIISSNQWILIWLKIEKGAFITLLCFAGGTMQISSWMNLRRKPSEAITTLSDVLLLCSVQLRATSILDCFLLDRQLQMFSG